MAKRLSTKPRVESFSNRYLNRVIDALQLPSDYALAEVLNVTTQAIYKIRGGGSTMSPTTAARIAEILEVDPLKVIAEVELERGTDDELWRRIARGRSPRARGCRDRRPGERASADSGVDFT